MAQNRGAYPRLRQRVNAWLWWRWLGLLLLPLLLSGCLRSDLTLRFDHHTHGEIQQTIALSDRGTALAQPTLTPWLEDLKGRSRPLGGQLTQGPQTVTLTVPFGTPADLVDRFQQLFTTEPADADAPAQLVLPGWGTVPYGLAIAQTNWGFATRTHLTYRLDLQSLPPNGDRAIEPPWADLRLRLQVPWGLQLAPTATPPLTTDPSGATWQLQPGTITTVEATFWLPNAIALGTLAITVLVLLGYLLRYRLFKSKLPTP